MAILARTGQVATWQTALVDPATGNRVTGADSGGGAIVAEVWVDDGAGARSRTALAVTVTEAGEVAGEYHFAFTPDTAGRLYVLTARHAATGWDVQQEFQTELLDAGGGGGSEVSQYLVSVGGEPFSVDQPLVVDLLFLNRQTMAKFNPFSIAEVELIARDAETVVETVLGAALVSTGLGQRRATFAAVSEPGIYFIAVYFTGVGSDEQTVQTWGLQVLNVAAEVVAGVMSVAELKTEYLAQIPGEAAKFDLLYSDNGTLLVSDDSLAALIRQESGYVERRLDVRLKTIRYATMPALPVSAPLTKGTDFDEEEDRYDWQAGYSSLWQGTFALRHVPVQKINRVRIVYGQTVLFEFPARWFQLNHRQGLVRIVVDAGSAESLVGAYNTGTLLESFIARATSMVTPMYWAFDYEAGLSESQLTDDIKALIGWRVARAALVLAQAKANKMGVKSQSVSKDGVSRSFSVADARYERVLASDHFREWTSEERLDRMRRRARSGLRAS